MTVLSVILNWLVCPLLMFGLALGTLGDAPGLMRGVVLVGIARCIAMVVVWNGLAGGSAGACAFIVAVNSCLQILLCAAAGCRAFDSRGVMQLARACAPPPPPPHPRYLSNLIHNNSTRHDNAGVRCVNRAA